MNTVQQPESRKAVSVGKQRNYNDIVDYLNQHWAIAPDLSLDRMRQLDKALGSLSQKIPSILVAGTNGKSLTVHFTAKLLKEEGLTVGTISAPHILLYNERFTLNNETISNKILTEIANKVIHAADQAGIAAHTSELLTAIALQFFHENNVDVAVMEVYNGGISDPVNIMPSQVVTITRVTPAEGESDEIIAASVKEMMGIVKKGTTITCGDQNKATLQLLQRMTEEQNGIWAMPIRKLANLPYPFEQLHGRCAALAERIAQTFINQTALLQPATTIVSDSLLCKQKGLRGRPTLEAKRHSELNPKRTLEQFWKETVNELPGKFQFLDKEKPSILLDTASNLDSFKNFLLGIRLLHYQRPLKGLAIIIAAAKNTLEDEEFLKQVRYFFKKISGHIFICALDEIEPDAHSKESWDIEKITHEIKNMKVKARACKNFEEAFELAKKTVDERNGLVAITGSQAIVHAYWKLKGIKKF